MIIALAAKGVDSSMLLVLEAFPSGRLIASSPMIILIRYRMRRMTRRRTGAASKHVATRAAEAIGQMPSALDKYAPLAAEPALRTSFVESDLSIGLQ